jgi:hypothetical protein
MGIEPTLVAWEATVLPLNYTRAGRRFYGCSRRAANDAPKAAALTAPVAVVARWQ